MSGANKGLSFLGYRSYAIFIAIFDHFFNHFCPWGLVAVAVVCRSILGASGAVACVVMAYIVMAYTVRAYVVMADTWSEEGVPFLVVSRRHFLQLFLAPF